MRHHAHSSSPAPAGAPPKQRPDSETLKRLFPYLWQYKWRVMAALAFMVGAKLANVSVPLLLKELIDAMSIKPNDPMAVLVVPVSLLVVYGVLRQTMGLRLSAEEEFNGADLSIHRIGATPERETTW